MSQFRRTHLAESLAEEIRSRILEGAYGDTLPGVRLLAGTLGVSVPTLCRALHHLRSAGVLSSEGARRRWRVVKPQNSFEKLPSIRRGQVEHRRLLYISPYLLSSEKFSGVEIFAALLDQLGSHGWDITHRMIPFTTAKKPHRSWDRLIELAKPDAIVVNSGNPVVAEWLAAKSVKSFFLGGDPGEIAIPILGVSTSNMLSDVLHRLLDEGHRSIWMPLCGRNERLLQRCEEVARKQISIAGTDAEAIKITPSGYASPEVLADMAARQWRIQAPDALIVIDWREFVALSGFFTRSGIQIPRDLSVVVLSHNSSMAWHRPVISHFEFPSKQIARKLSNWITDPGRINQESAVGKRMRGASGSNCDRRMPLAVWIPPRWVEGASLIARPLKANKSRAKTLKSKHSHPISWAQRGKNPDFSGPGF